MGVAQKAINLIAPTFIPIQMRAAQFHIRKVVSLGIPTVVGQGCVCTAGPDRALKGHGGQTCMHQRVMDDCQNLPDCRWIRHGVSEHHANDSASLSIDVYVPYKGYTNSRLVHLFRN
jgi:hypothetical protein